MTTCLCLCLCFGSFYPHYFIAVALPWSLKIVYYQLIWFPQLSVQIQVSILLDWLSPLFYPQIPSTYPYFATHKKCPLYVAKKYPLFCPLYLQPCPIAATLPFLMGIPLFKGFVTWLAFFFMKTPKSPGNLIDLRRGLSSPFGNICLKSQVAPFLPPFQPFFCFVSLSEMLYLCCPL